MGRRAPTAPHRNCSGTVWVWLCEFFFAGLGFQSHVRDLILIPEPSEIRSRKAQFSLNASEP